MVVIDLRGPSKHHVSVTSVDNGTKKYGTTLHVRKDSGATAHNINDTAITKS